LNDLYGNLPWLRTLGKIFIEKPSAGSDLVINARLPLFIRREAGMNQHVQRSINWHANWLAKVHHRAPPFRMA
jgi:hypothetical protein